MMTEFAGCELPGGAARHAGASQPTRLSVPRVSLKIFQLPGVVSNLACRGDTKSAALSARQHVWSVAGWDFRMQGSSGGALGYSVTQLPSTGGAVHVHETPLKASAPVSVPCCPSGSEAGRTLHHQQALGFMCQRPQPAPWGRGPGSGAAGAALENILTKRLLFFLDFDQGACTARCHSHPGVSREPGPKPAANVLGC